MQRLCFQAAEPRTDSPECILCSEHISSDEASLRCAGDSGMHHYFHLDCLGGWAGACHQFSAFFDRGSAPMCRGCQSSIEVETDHLAAALQVPQSAAAKLREDEHRFLEDVLKLARAGLREGAWGDPFVQDMSYFGALGCAAVEGFCSACAAAGGAAQSVRSAVEDTLVLPAQSVRDLGTSMGQLLFGRGDRRQVGQSVNAGDWGKTFPAMELNGPPVQPSGTKRALLIGCNYPGTQVELSGCINDVQRMLGLLLQVYGFPRAAIRVLVDDGSAPGGLPTRAEILEGVRWLVRGVQKGDSLFFHFSGHGAQQLDPQCAEEDGYDETICPTDFQQAGMIIDGELFDSMVAPLPSGAKLTAVMDCCHSGTGLDLPFAWDPAGRCWLEDENPCHSAGDVQLISGCEDWQTPADAAGGAPSGRWAAAGAMTTALCYCLEEARRRAPPAGAEAGPWPPLPYDELLDRMHGELARRGFEQVPQLTSSQAFDAASRKPFAPCGEALANRNPQLGRHFRTKKHPKRLLDDPFYSLAGITTEGVLATSSTLLPWAQLFLGEHHQDASRKQESPGEEPGSGVRQSPLTSWGIGDAVSGSLAAWGLGLGANEHGGIGLPAGGGPKHAGAGQPLEGCPEHGGGHLPAGGVKHDGPMLLGGDGGAGSGGCPLQSEFEHGGESLGQPLSGWGLGRVSGNSVGWGSTSTGVKSLDQETDSDSDSDSEEGWR